MVRAYKVCWFCDYRSLRNNVKMPCLNWQGFDSVQSEAIRVEHTDFQVDSQGLLSVPGLKPSEKASCHHNINENCLDVLRKR